MKRLFVLPKFQGLKAGRLLLTRLIEVAVERSYTILYLDSAKRYLWLKFENYYIFIIYGLTLFL